MKCFPFFHRWRFDWIERFPTGNSFTGNCIVHERCNRCDKARSRVLYDPEAR